ncbi:cytochrome P450 [Nocardia noduli]|uniref:cytochrome P450 n=1 Tax=Nocardia noduli TaxID=2815722 RepID=UPI001C23B7FE|nr:cytochrome P450 [Nocardia noduli]
MTCTLDSDEFSADAPGAYRKLRDGHGPVAVVELEGRLVSLVLGYPQALAVLGDPDGFSSHPHSSGHPVMACPAATGLRVPGESSSPFALYQSMLERLDLNAVRRVTGEIAMAHIAGFCEQSSVDLLTGFAIPVTCAVFESIFGLTRELGNRAYQYLGFLRETVDPAAAAGLAEVMGAAIAAHPVGSTADRLGWLRVEGADQVQLARHAAALYAWCEPTWNLIANTLRMAAADKLFGGDLLGGGLSVREAVDQVLYTDPPLGNGLVTYPQRPMPQSVAGVEISEQYPVVISIAAANADPMIDGGDRTGNRAHLAWGARDRVCPAQPLASTVAIEALEQMLDVLPEITIDHAAGPLRYLPGGVHRALAALPVRFPPTRILTPTN